MGSCCETKGNELAALRERQGRVLVVVLVINLAMFFVEFIGGWLAQSTALMRDSLDMLGEASVYAVACSASCRKSLGWAPWDSLRSPPTPPASPCSIATAATT